MQVFDEVTQKYRSIFECTRVVLEHRPELIIFGYSSNENTIVDTLVYAKGGPQTLRIDKELFKGPLVYSQRRGIYISPVNFPEKDLFIEANIKGQGGFPYNFARKYEAIESFNLFEGRQKVLDLKDYLLSHFLKYTFGLEFETSMGYIPEDLCFRDGLIPLRDGSITGLEYSTVVLNGNEGISLLKQEINTLKKYTAFNKECSLHIHLGGFPLNSNLIYRAQRLCKMLEPSMENLVPDLTFRSSMYKDNEKDYCSKLNYYDNFNEMYEGLVGRPFLGDFTQPHPNDIARKAKWRIPTRYYWVNFINLICYKVNKTIEFRLLRPTYNFKKIELWLYIFNAILMYAENIKFPIDMGITLSKVINRVYPPNVAKLIDLGLIQLQILSVTQKANGDRYGHDIEFENELFPETLEY